MALDDLTGLKILHVIRAPLGGLFRHVLDLSEAQIERGCRVGLIADSLTGGAWADDVLKALEPRLALGLSRVPIQRNLHISDLAVRSHVASRIRNARPDIVHGHGSKGGAFARLSASRFGHEKVAYTPHGGSFNYRPGSGVHSLYMLAERLLATRTDVFLFESSYIHGRFHEYATSRTYLERVVPNGIKAEEMEPIVTDSDAADFVYVGELRSAKGIDTLLLAMAELARRRDRAPTLRLVGNGPDETALGAMRDELGLTSRVTFVGRWPARQAFAKGRVLVVPSRAESLPYVVLEAVGAQMPIVSTNVGGIPEIFGPYGDQLIPCDDVGALANALEATLDASTEELARRAEPIASYVASRFTIRAMVEAVLDGYRSAMGVNQSVGAQRVTPSSVSS